MKHILIKIILLLISNYKPKTQNNVQHILKNQYLQLNFDEQNQLIKIINKKTNTQYIHPTPENNIGHHLNKPSTPFIINTYPTNQSYHFQNYQKKQTSNLSLTIPKITKKKKKTT